MITDVTINTESTNDNRSNSGSIGGERQDTSTSIQERPRQSRSRGWVFTWNNYDSTVLDHIERCGNAIDPNGTSSLQYICYGQENAPNTGTPHLQGYFYFSSLKSFRQSREFILGGCLGSPYIDNAKGSPYDNINYCSKDGNFKEWGVRPGFGQGKRSDLEGVVHEITEGKSIEDITKSHPIEFIKYHKGIQALKSLTYSVRTFKTTVHWYYGDTGTGKSKLAYETAVATGSYYYKDPTNKWWDGYFQQDVVIIDDYRRDFCTFAHLLRLFDRYPLSVEFKGGTIQFASKVIIVTTPKSPKETWEGRSCEDLAQLTRRISTVRFFPFPLIQNND